MNEKNKQDDNIDISRLEEEISNFFEDLMYDYGGSPLLGRIYSLCILNHTDNYIAQKDLGDIFKVNASTISRNINELETWGLISKRREPGSREWKYQVGDTSFLELFLRSFEKNSEKLEEKREELIRIKGHWGDTFAEQVKNNKKGQHALKVLNLLIEWIKVVEQELNQLITNLNKKYLELERKMNKI